MNDLYPYLKAGKESYHTDTFSANGTWVAPLGAYQVYVEAWGGGGSGSNRTSVTGGSGGGAGGSYAASAVSITPGNSYAVVVGAGGTSTTSTANNGGDSSFGGTTVVAQGGQRGFSSAGGAGDISTSIGDIKYPGGNGGNGGGAASAGGGGGEGASSSGAGNNGTNGNAGSQGGTGTAGGDGGAGRTGTVGAGNPGSVIGGAGGGGLFSGSAVAGGNGARGEVRITYLLKDGDAGVLHVVANRAVGNASITFDATEMASSNFPDKIIGCTGTLAANGFIDPSTKTEMRLTKASSTQYTIDAFLSGSTDIGNFENQVMIVRPSTHFANAVAGFLENANGLGTPENWVTGAIDAENLIGDSLVQNDVVILDGVANATYRYTVSSDAYAGLGAQVTFPHGLAYTPRVRARYSSSFNPDIFNPLPECIVSASSYGDTPSLKVNIQSVDATNITVGIAIQDAIGLSTMLSRHNLLFQFYCSRFAGL